MEFIKLVQSFSNPFLDLLFQLITMVGEDIFFMLVTAVIYWCFNKELGYKLGFVTLTSAVVNIGLKDVFKVPRPIGEPGIRSLRVQTAGGYSFPSGHSQNTATLWTFFMIRFKRMWLYVVGIITILLVGLSRIYLGVHTPLDVVCGIIIGTVWVVIWNFMYEKSRKSKYNVLVIVAILLASAGMFIFYDADYYKAVGALTGLLLGCFIETRYIRFDVKAPPEIQMIKMVLGLAAVYALRVILKRIMPELLISDYIRYLLILLWITVVTPWLIKHFVRQ